MKTTADSWRTRHYPAMVALLRITFGLVWVIDGLMKFVFMAPSDVTDLVQGAGQGQPDWLSGWFNFWNGFVSSNPTGVLYMVGILELLLGLALIFGLLRRISYVGGMLLSFFIWAVDEGFGGPYGAGSTDIGAAIIYVFVFFALLIIDASGRDSYSLDAVIARKK